MKLHDQDLPEWLEDLARYQVEQSRSLAIGTWPRETALRERAIASTITIALATMIAAEYDRKKTEGDLYTFPPLSSAFMTEISQQIEGAILSGCWLQSQRALEYLDDHPNDRR